MQLKMDTKIIHRVNYSDLEDFVKEVYGHEFSFVADEESGNDEASEYAVDGYVTDYNAAELRTFVETGRHQFLTSVLLDDMCDQGLIPAGDYIVSVSW